MTDRKTVYKWWWVWDFEKEEQWLNSMAIEGWALEDVGFCKYCFVQCKPGEYTIRLEMHGDDDQYIRFMREIDAEYIGRVIQWVYFRRKSEYGAFDIFSDIDSRIKHMNRIAGVLRVVGIGNIIIGLVNAFNYSGFGIINLLLGCLVMYGLGRIRGKEDELEKERTLHE